MSNATALSIREFLIDIRSVCVTPSKRFAVIHERGAIWGSILLMMVPTYFALWWTGGIYFDHDPLPGYSLLLPAVVGFVLVFLKMLLIHLFARLFQWSQDSSVKRGSFGELTVLFGYAGVPNIAALLLALLLFLFIPDQLSTLVREYHTVAISIMISVGIALFIWNFILMVLALHFIYPMRDLKLVLALILGLVATTVLTPMMGHMATPVKVELSYLQPVLQQRILRFFSADSGGAPRDIRAEIHIDTLVYRLKKPQRFDLVAFSPNPAAPAVEKREAGIAVAGAQPDRHVRGSNQIVGRIVGEPGDSVQYAAGRLIINGQAWSEQYIAPEFDSKIDTPLRKLGADEYLILPENRHLVSGNGSEWVISRARIAGRVILVKWPMGWWVYRPSVLLHAHPE